LKEGDSKRPLLLRLIVPGWAHCFVGQCRTGALVLLVFIACVIASLAAFGSQWGTLCMGCTFLVHQWAVVDVINWDMPKASFGVRFRYAGSCMAVLAICFYLPAALAASFLADPVRCQLSVDPLRSGDVLLMNRLLHSPGWPRVGDIVLYEIPEETTPVLLPSGESRLYLYTGRRIDRILANSGDKVVWNDGELYINDQLSAIRPLNPTHLPDRFIVEVPKDCVLIAPTTTPEPIPGVSTWLQLACVPKPQVLGEVYWRWQPLSRFGPIQ
jgi:Signal peptidase, peptidase S26